MTDEVKTAIGKRFKDMRGPRTLATMADKMHCSPQRASQIERGDVPESYLYLYRLAVEEGVDLNTLICGNGRKK